MFRALMSFWPLFFGLGMIGFNIGMQNSLLGIRASMENFSIMSTGLMMSGYFAGYFAGAIYIPNIIAKVGHIRTFGAFGSVTSMVILIHAYFVDPFVWTLMRFISGVSMMAIFLVAESWLNADSSNNIRGTVLSLYVMVLYAGYGSSQFCLNLGNPAESELFVMISIVASLSMIPMLLKQTHTPCFSVVDKIKIVELYKISPLGVLGNLFNNVINSMLLAMGAVFASQIGLSLSDISLFMAAMLFSGVLFLWPIGKLSDLVDRRIIIFACALLGAVCAVIGALYCHTNSALLFVIIALLGGFCLPIYSLCLAHMNDSLSPEQFVSAGATMSLVAGVGLVSGPFLTALFLRVLGSQGFFWGITAPCGVLTLFTAWRICRYPPVSIATTLE